MELIGQSCKIVLFHKITKKKKKKKLTTGHKLASKKKAFDSLISGY